MEKKIEDYLHLYIGCRVFDQSVYNDLTPGLLAWVIEKKRANELKPILRPLSDITEEEADERCWKGRKGFKYFCENNDGKFDPDDTHYLLSRGFDLFDLIESGLAIDKSKTPHQ